MQKRLKVLVYGILVIFLLFGIYDRNKNPTIVETFSVDSYTEEEVMDELVTAFFIEEITKEITNFYQ